MRNSRKHFSNFPVFTENIFRLIIKGRCDIVISLLHKGVMVNMDAEVKKDKVFRTLFWSSLNMSLMMIGAGYLAIGMMRSRFVHELKWIDEEEMLDLSAIARSAPGAIAVNIAILIGYRIAGIAGALVTVLGTVTPPLVVITAIGMYYTTLINNTIISAALRGMGAGAAALMVDMVISMGWDVFKSKSIVSISILVIVFLLNHFLNVSIFLIVIWCIVLGIAIAVTKKVKKVQVVPEKVKEEGEEHIDDIF